MFSWRALENSGNQVRKIALNYTVIILVSALQPTTQLPYVCKAFLPKPRPDDDRGALLPCDSDHGWYPSSTHDDRGHYCIRIFPDKKPFFEADHTCTAIHGGHLVSIHSGLVSILSKSKLYDNLSANIYVNKLQTVKIKQSTVQFQPHKVAQEIGIGLVFRKMLLVLG